MRIICMSDSHGGTSKVEQVFEAHAGDADAFIHLGDGMKEFRKVSARYPDKFSVCIEGNCDTSYAGDALGETKVVELAGKRILITHGHRYNVKLDLLGLSYAAQQEQADVALFGHTHRSHIETLHGVLFVNPGALSHSRDPHPTYAVIDIIDGMPSARIETL